MTPILQHVHSILFLFFDTKLVLLKKILGWELLLCTCPAFSIPTFLLGFSLSVKVYWIHIDLGWSLVLPLPPPTYWTNQSCDYHNTWFILLNTQSRPSVTHVAKQNITMTFNESWEPQLFAMKVEPLAVRFKLNHSTSLALIADGIVCENRSK